MATASVARPAQPLRKPDKTPRPVTAKRNTLTSEQTNGAPLVVAADSEPVSKKRRLEKEPFVHTSAYILQKHRRKPVSMTVHLHQNYFRFDNQEGSWAYDSPMRFIIEHLRKKTIPHEILEDLLAQRVPFYDGCLIVELHNHRQANGTDRSRSDAATAGGQTRFSMNNYTTFITPSPFVPYPQKAKIDELAVKSAAASLASEKRGIDKEKQGPHISTVVLHPTPMSRHKEIEMLARTKASDLIGANGRPSTPSLGVQPLSISASRTSPAENESMVVDARNAYEFEASMLLYTEPPLFLEPVQHPEQAQKVLDLLSNTLHNDAPPSPKTRKRTTAQMAADDAQAAEAERRMLMMDERIKPSVGAGAATGESQGAAASLGISRFKTIQMAKEKIAEQEAAKEAAKKAEEAQAAAKRREQEEVLRNQEKQRAEEQSRKEVLAQRTEQARLHAAAAKARDQQAALQAQQQQANAHAQALAQAQAQANAQAKQAQALQQLQMNQSLGQLPQNGMLNQQANNIQNAATANHNSPLIRQQTPMINSSPMMPQGFPVAPTNQGAGSPPRPGSAVMPSAMARQASQQQPVSRHNTPQMAQGTPNLQVQGMANRAMSQTPRLPQASPAPGTPVPGGVMPNMAGQNGLTPEQMALLQARQRQTLANRVTMQGSPAQNGAMQMTPQQIQMVMQRHPATQRLIAQASDSSNPEAAAQARIMLNSPQYQQQIARAAQQNAQAASLMASPHPGMVNNPQLAQGVPQQAMSQDQLRMQQTLMFREGQRQLNALAQQYGSVQAVPANAYTPQMKFWYQHSQRQQQARAAAAAQMMRQAQLAQNSGQAVAGVGGSDPAYMQALQNSQQQHAMLMAAQQQQQQNGNHMGNAGVPSVGMGMGAGMGVNNMQQFGNAQAELAQQYANMQSAITQQNRQQGGMQ